LVKGYVYLFLTKKSIKEGIFMKKSLLAAAVMSLFLAACGGDKPAAEASVASGASDVVASEVASEASEVVAPVASEASVEAPAASEGSAAASK
jgi:hypothetical protein